MATESPEQSTGDDEQPTTHRRREVLRGVGGSVGGASLVGALAGDGSGLRARFRDLAGSGAAASRRSAEAQDFSPIVKALRQMGGDCGPEPLEVHGGRFEGCCEMHDSCCEALPCDAWCNTKLAICVAVQW